MKIGDIYYWRYKDEKRNSDYLSYHAKSCIAIVDEDGLYDTFWSTRDTYSSSWSLDRAKEILELKYVGNFSELENISPWEKPYYKPEDIVDLRHSNNSSEKLVFKRKGSQRDKNVILELLNYKAKDAQYKSSSEFNNSIRIKEQIERVENGMDLEQVWV